MAVSSIDRVRRHREQIRKLLVNLKFLQRSSTKTKYLRKYIKHTLRNASSISRFKSIVDVVNSQSPNTGTNIVSSIKPLTSILDMEPF